ncbi:DoxX family protein [Chitinophaga rhizophila]|uniref:DoxX family protein n=1 Tax=Chitinophaga rhizophila TaxID=2866212 RepID=A0ABS7GB86_9BACT|nr:DoxX family protein [Chitinophaga rhizophila]MBW8684525.1 DoxX family protein [Chitinophaga rhizophila]
MKTNKISIFYWVSTIVFALMMLADGLAGLAHEATGVAVMKHLGYPEYILTILGIAKILGALAIIQTKFDTLKEWAFAGFTINFIGACFSRLAIGDPAGELIAPLVALLILSVPYYAWKRYKAAKSYTPQLAVR